MLDPREQKKGGFGAFVDRENERGAAAEAARVRAAEDGTGAPPRTGPVLVQDEKRAPLPGTTLEPKPEPRPLPLDRGPRR
ncbi:MAG TPA: hypothetical protein VFZ11_13160 [Gemmatimonadaceae bacterium]